MRTIYPLLLACLCASLPAFAGVEVFGKGSVSKNFLAADKSTISVSMTGGIAIGLVSSVRLEARYSNISSLQNKLDIQVGNTSGTLTDIKTQTAIYSAGLDIEFFGDKSAFQPFIYLGAGYIETERSYFVSDGVDVVYIQEPKQSGISANGGLGFRVRLARSLSFEVEAFAYATDIQTKSPLINMYGTAGIRLYL